MATEILLSLRYLKIVKQKMDNTLNSNYLNSNLSFEEGRVMDMSTGFAVMMEWETPLMEESADFLCHYPGRVLNIGHGMGIIDSFISSKNPVHHYIIEGHPQVWEENLVKKGWLQKPNTTCIFSDWRNVDWNSLPYFDAIYIDTFMEDEEDFMKNILPRILAPGGRFSWFNNSKSKDQVLEENKVKIMQEHDYVVRHKVITNFKAPDPFLQSGGDAAYWFPDWDKYILPIVYNRNLGITGSNTFKLWN
jgi:protein arginine N-methyltransferase 2